MLNIEDYYNSSKQSDDFFNKLSTTFQRLSFFKPFIFIIKKSKKSERNLLRNKEYKHQKRHLKKLD